MTFDLKPLGSRRRIAEGWRRRHGARGLAHGAM
jgi:hypothetical protein